MTCSTRCLKRPIRRYTCYSWLRPFARVSTASAAAPPYRLPRCVDKACIYPVLWRLLAIRLTVTSSDNDVVVAGVLQRLVVVPRAIPAAMSQLRNLGTLRQRMLLLQLLLIVCIAWPRVIILIRRILIHLPSTIRLKTMTSRQENNYESS